MNKQADFTYQLLRFNKPLYQIQASSKKAELSSCLLLIALTLNFKHPIYYTTNKIITLCTSIVPQRPCLLADLPVDGSAVSSPTITIFTFNPSSLLALSAAIPKFERVTSIVSNNH